jgi:hypothetical protein
LAERRGRLFSRLEHFINASLSLLDRALCLCFPGIVNAVLVYVFELRQGFFFLPAARQAVLYPIFYPLDSFALSRFSPHLQTLFLVACFLWQIGHSAKIAIQFTPQLF